MAKEEAPVAVGDFSFLKGMDPNAGFGGDQPPTTIMPFVKWVDATSDLAKDGKCPPYCFFDLATETALKPPIMICPIYTECSWVEWLEGEFGQDPIFKTSSYKDAIEHFPKDDRGRSTEYFHRVYIFLTNVEGLEGPRVIQFSKTAAQAAERLLSIAKTVKFPGVEQIAPIFSQWWELSVTDAISKATGNKYKKQTLTFKEVDQSSTFIKANYIAMKDFSKTGFLLGGGESNGNGS